jgi:N-acetylneuraminic acid mutarotase
LPGYFWVLTMQRAVVSTIFVAVVLFCIVWVCPSSAITQPASTNVWATLADMPHERFQFQVAVVEGKLYAIGGNYVPRTVTHISSTADQIRFEREILVAYNEEYDPETNQWTEKTPMPTALGCFYAIGAVQNKIHCILGAVHEVYDPATDSWTTAKVMPNPSNYPQTASVVNCKIYVMTIGDPQGNLLQVYDPTADSWAVKAPASPCSLNFGLNSVVIDDKIFLITNSIQAYDPATNDWSFVTTTPSPNEGEAAAATSGVHSTKAIYIIGGRNPTNPIGTLWSVKVFFPETGTWGSGIATAQAASMYQGITVIDDIIYMMGGQHNIFTPQINYTEMYIPYGYDASAVANPLASLAVSPSLSPSPTLSPTASPSPTETPQRSTQPEPTQLIESPQTIETPKPATSHPNTLYAAAIGVASVAIIAILLAVKSKKGRAKPPIL